MVWLARSKVFTLKTYDIEQTIAVTMKSAIIRKPTMKTFLFLVIYLRLAPFQIKLSQTSVNKTSNGKRMPKINL